MAAVMGRYGSLLNPKPVPIPSAPMPAPGRAGMAMPSYAPNAAIPSYGGAPRGGAAPAGGGLYAGMLGGLKKPQSSPDPFGDLDPDHRKQLDQFYNSLAGSDYKGSFESGQMQRNALANLYRMWESEGPVDMTGAAKIGDFYRNRTDRTLSDLAARGISGGGFEAGARSSLAGSEGAATGDYYRQMLSERQQQHHNDYSKFLDWARQMEAFGLQQNIAEQNAPGFFDKLLGVAGSVAGGFIP